jgi:predicted RNA-binding Zn-ribbon protein involved in translation (DUF1610 family)
MHRKRKRCDEQEQKLQDRVFSRIKEIENEEADRYSFILSEITRIEQTTFPPGNKYIHESMARARTLSRLRAQLDEMREKSDADRFADQVMPLCKTLVETNSSDRAVNALLLSLVSKEDVGPSSINRDVCISCGASLFVVSSESTTVCKKCGRTTLELIHASHRPEGGTEHSPDPACSSGYDRLALYHKYLLQFTGPPPPHHVLASVYSTLATSNHTMEPFRAPVVAKVLKELGFEKLAPSSVRISRILNGEPEILLDYGTIEKLKIRSSNSSFLFDGVTNRKNSHNFEFLTRNFLFSENMNDLAEKFNGHKMRKSLNSDEPMNE